MKYEYFELKEYNTIAKKERVSTLTAKAIEAYNMRDRKYGLVKED